MASSAPWIMRPFMPTIAPGISMTSKLQASQEIWKVSAQARPDQIWRHLFSSLGLLTLSRQLSFRYACNKPLFGLETARSLVLRNRELLSVRLRTVGSLIT